MLSDEEYMKIALEEAKKAYALQEVPIGAILVDEKGRVVAKGHNLRENAHDGTAHAEIEAIRSACSLLQRWRLSDLTMYVTIEPCAMCAGALVNSRIKKLVYGSGDIKAGGVDSVFNIVNHRLLNHRIEVISGILEDECKEIMRNFFAMRRKQNKEAKAQSKRTIS